MDPKYWEERGAKAMAKVPMAELVGHYQQLSGAGRYWKGIEHDSLIVDNDNGFYYWNSKGERGNHITWLYNYEPSVTKYSEAIKFLEDFSGNLPEEMQRGNFVAKPKAERILPELKLADEYHANLLNNAEAWDWWIKRGVAPESIEKWKLGYKPNHWNRGRASSIPIIERGELKTIRHRLWYPGYDALGKPKAKYVPEIIGSGSWVFNASCLDENPEEILILEGEIKLMVAYNYGQVGIALSGIGNLPMRYIPKLSKVKRIYICPDPILNAKEQISPYELSWVRYLVNNSEVRVVRLPEKIDDLLLSHKRAYRILEAAKLDAKVIKAKDMEAVNLKKSQERENRALLLERRRYNKPTLDDRDVGYDYS